MKIPIEQIKALMNSLGNILILAEEDKLTEQCGVNTSNTFNTPPPRPAFIERDIKNVSAGVLHPSDMELGEDWTVYTLKFKCNDCDTEWSLLSEIPSDNYECSNPPCGQIVASYHSESHSLNALKKEKQEFLEDEESEEEGEPDSYYELDPETRELVRREKPRGADPVERLLDYISEAFTDEHCQTRPSNDTKNWYPDGVSQLCAPSHLHHLADAAQDFLDKRVEGLKKHIEGLEEIAKRYRPDLDVLDEFPKLHFKNVHVIRQLLWELGVGRENKTD